MIDVKGLVKTYGSKRAVDGVSFTVKRGEILGFLGPNGAGKSTTMKMITGFVRPDSGTASVDGIDVLEDPVAVKRKLGYLPESAPAYPEMTVAEFLGFIAEVRGFREPKVLRFQVDPRDRAHPPGLRPPPDDRDALQGLQAAGRLRPGAAP
jgi:ABC-2 type transport system ATP-binding protein